MEGVELTVATIEIPLIVFCKHFHLVHLMEGEGGREGGRERERERGKEREGERERERGKEREGGREGGRREREQSHKLSTDSCYPLMLACKIYVVFL